MFGKIINNTLFVANDRIKTSTGWIINPTEEQLRAEGYKEVIYTEPPTYDDEEQKLDEVYNVSETQIIVAYTLVNLTDEEHNEIIQMKIDEEEAKITARNIRGAIKGDNFALNRITEVENNIAQLRAKLRWQQKL